MSRFADPRATRTVDLGACECPGTPHPRDEVVLRSEYSGSEIAAIAALGTDEEETAAAGFVPYIVSWNLHDPDGQPWPPSGESLLALKQATLSAIIEGITVGIRESITLPNASGAPSPASSRGSASRTRPRTPKPTT